MAVLKCRMCGGDLVYEPGATVCECEYCGSKQTIPNADNEKKMTLFARANRLLRACEFDKAEGIFESIVAEFPEEAEAYWGLVLCKYGIEYVDDPATGKKVPTCHRSSFNSVMDDADFEQVMENADTLARAVYREQAKQIEELRKGIIEVSGKEEPYDIFICYKETDENKERTLDSVLAQDIYDALTGKGYRVFFSRISLEDKLGVAYEPYIFAALNSAKVMLAIGTTYDYYNAVWVKNEWSRFLKLMAADKEKYLIPCYKDIDAYDIPKEFAKLQAQDLGKVGALQDLLRGIEKLIGTGKTMSQSLTASTVVVQSGTNIEALLKRGYMFLEDGSFEEASDYFNRVLDLNAENAEAYLGLFISEIHAHGRAEAKSEFIARDLTDNRYWKRARMFAKGDIAHDLDEWESSRLVKINKEIEELRLKAEKEEAIRAKKEKDAEALRLLEQQRAEDEIKSVRKKLQSDELLLTEEQKKEYDQLCTDIIKAEEETRKAKTRYEELLYSPELKRLSDEISEKKLYLSKLGIFKGKEKKAVQDQIFAMEKNYYEMTERLEQCKKNYEDKQKEEALLTTNKEVYLETSKEARQSLSERILKLLGTVGAVIEGDKYFTFGKYGKGSENRPIEWIALSRQADSILLISKDIIDCRKFNTDNVDITWENSSLRKWLNEDFYESAFTNYGRALIKTTSVKAESNANYSTDQGKDTQDKIFLLSISEAEKYFSSDQDRQSEATAYAKKNGARQDANGKYWWWLRSMGQKQNKAAVVRGDGAISSSGNFVDNDARGVRPALWIDFTIMGEV